MKHISVNACLFPAAAAHGCHVTTVEGLAAAKRGDVGDNLVHPIQERMVKLHGSQCGYCVSISLLLLEKRLFVFSSFFFFLALSLEYRIHHVS